MKINHQLSTWRCIKGDSIKTSTWQLCYGEGKGKIVIVANKKANVANELSSKLENVCLLRQ